ncbi:Mitochondrial thiamine pyrophosphate carrier [Taenia crassiceps]|uniref:Mitochondrial thiamine pyrophosphate carrier n=1 Tax=Taenia crassiceps TaxID=6207 RepID=A0ABR4QJ11_9CEST
MVGFDVSSGFCGRACVQPLDVVKVRFQLQVEPISTVQASAKYRSVFQAIRCIIKEEGFGAFWKGHLSSQILAVSYSGVQFTSFELYTRWCAQILPRLGENSDNRQAIASVVNFTCGCLAGVTSATCTQPLDVLKTRFIAQGEPRVYNNLREAIATIARKEGFRGFFRGLSPSILLTAPQTGLNFAVYKLTIHLIDLWETRILGRLPTSPTNASLAQSVFAGAFAGMVSKCMVYPMDVAKKRLQVQGFEEARNHFGSPLVVRGLRDCIVKTWRIEGLAGLFKGLQPSILKACLSMGCRFAVYEKVCNFLSHRNTSRAAMSKVTE